MYSFNYSKGQKLHHPEDLVSFYVVTEQLIFIMFKALTIIKTIGASE
jgi:hypothetical protein